MKALRFVTGLALAGMAAALPAQTEKGKGPVERETPDKAEDVGERVDDRAWRDTVAVIEDTGSQSANTAKADAAKDFYTRFPGHAQAKEARKLEALFLVNAVSQGAENTRGRMKASVDAIRQDVSMPAFDRAVVAGTYEFREAIQRVRTTVELEREFESVARGLIHEFPDQPQGYIALLTRASIREPAAAREIVMEVLASSSAPAEAMTEARRLLNRLDLLGRPASEVLGEALADRGPDGWRSGRPGLIYFWATWNPDSVLFGKQLGGRKLARVNVVGVCLDTDVVAAEAVATEHQLPGQMIYLPGGPENELAVTLGANAAPMLYLVDASGRFTDVRGLDNLESKLTDQGL